VFPILSSKEILLLLYNAEIYFCFLKIFLNHQVDLWCRVSISILTVFLKLAGIANPVQRLAMDWAVWGWNPSVVGFYTLS